MATTSGTASEGADLAAGVSPSRPSRRHATGAGEIRSRTDVPVADAGTAFVATRATPKSGGWANAWSVEKSIAAAWEDPEFAEGGTDRRKPGHGDRAGATTLSPMIPASR
ncbi:MAG: hypothetical protein U0163_10995 [Gemmatimonadaceae bacterium]